MLKTYFLIRRSTLYCRFTDKDQNIIEVSTGKKLLRSEFNSKLQHSESHEVNRLLIRWKEIAKRASIHNVKELINSESHDLLTLSELVDNYILSKPELSDGTIEKYRGFANILLRYCPRFDLSIDRISKADIMGIYKSFRNHMSINSAHKRMQQLTIFLNHAVAFEMIDRNVMNGLKFKKEQKEIVFLDKEELDRIKTKEIDIERLELVRDIFVFQCYTGCEYSRVSELKDSNVVKGIDSNIWIDTVRKKTGKRAKVLLHPVALDLLEKYSGNEYCFPVISNVKMNAYLKEIGSICGIKKKLHTHLARHTFATTICLLNGLSFGVTAKMMGISVSRLESTYGKIVDQRVVREVKDSWLRDAV